MPKTKQPTKLTDEEAEVVSAAYLVIARHLDWIKSMVGADEISLTIKELMTITVKKTRPNGKFIEYNWTFFEQEIVDSLARNPQRFVDQVNNYKGWKREE